MAKITKKQSILEGQTLINDKCSVLRFPSTCDFVRQSCTLGTKIDDTDSDKILIHEITKIQSPLLERTLPLSLLVQVVPKFLRTFDMTGAMQRDSRAACRSRSRSREWSPKGGERRSTRSTSTDSRSP